MRPSNQPDIALAQEWLGQIDGWVAQHGLRGYDPFDIKQHPLISSAQSNPLTRKATTALSDLFPNLLRRLLQIEPTENPKAYALVAMGLIRLFQLTQDQQYRDRARQMLQWLVEHATPGYAGLCWGYPFSITAKGVSTPAGTPVLVISAIAGDAFTRAYALTGQEEYREAALSIGQFILKELPRMPEADGTLCFGYTPGDRRRVHNANLLAAEHLYRCWSLTGDAETRVIAAAALKFTVDRQRDDGAWTYGEWSEGEPYDPALLGLIDHHHTGFVLRSLHAINEIEPSQELLERMTLGFAYYKKHLFQGAYYMPINEYGKYPVDIHACAEGILCPTVLADVVMSARGIAPLTMRWTHFFLRDRKTHLPYYRKYPFYTSKLIAPRWGVAWMHLALAEYLYREYGGAGQAGC